MYKATHIAYSLDASVPFLRVIPILPCFGYRNKHFTDHIPSSSNMVHLPLYYYFKSFVTIFTIER